LFFQLKLAHTIAYVQAPAFEEETRSIPILSQRVMDETVCRTFLQIQRDKAEYTGSLS